MNTRVLTFNTLFRDRSRARLGVLARLLDQSDYDVVCLQEVISPLNLAHLRRAVKSYPYIAHARTFPVVRGGLVTLSRWPISRRRYEPFKPTRPPRPEWLLRKGALFTRVRLPGNGFLTVVNTHLSANMDMHWAPSNVYTKAEESELRELAALIGRIDPAEPMVVMGDFNVPRDTPSSATSRPPPAYRTPSRATPNPPTAPTTRTSAPSTRSSPDPAWQPPPVWSSKKTFGSPMAGRPPCPTTTP